MTDHPTTARERLSEAWISVLDKLPDDGIDVLIHVPGASEPVWIGHYDGESGDWRWCDGGAVWGTVTHWMEIPEGPA